MQQSVLLLLCCATSLGMSHQRKVECETTYELPNPSSRECPSKVVHLKLELVTVGEQKKLNISWAINIDASHVYLNGTRVTVGGTPYICKYNPPFSEVNHKESQEWFHFLINVRYGSYFTDVVNVPLCPLGTGNRILTSSMWVRRPKQVVTVRTPDVFTPFITTKPPKDIPATGMIVGMVAIVILSSCFIIYKIIVSHWGYNILPVVPTPVSVVLVYPADTPAFQRAVVAMAEFLQWHGGCRVMIDIWQQGKIAELGPLRWLAEQVNNADRVLIISPLTESPSSIPGHCASTAILPKHSIPAAAGDLYPLILNMVASHARSATELAKFWVVQLHADRDEKSCVLLPELRTCRAFSVMKDLNRLCESLHAQKTVGREICSRLFKPKAFYSEKSTAKLREAIKMLSTKKPGISNRILNKDLC